MSHLDTAYKLGAIQAMEDFRVELEKQSTVPLQPRRVPGQGSGEGTVGAPAYGDILAGASKGPTGGVIKAPTGTGNVNVPNTRGPGNAPPPRVKNVLGQ